MESMSALGKSLSERAKRKAQQRYHDRSAMQQEIKLHPDFATKLDIVERTANQFLMDLGKDDNGETAFSRYKQAVNLDPTISHHNDPHKVRIEYIAEGLAHLGLSDEQKQALIESPALRALHLSLGMHDLGQNFRYYRKEHEGAKGIKTKPGHGMEAALMIWASYKEYAQALHIEHMALEGKPLVGVPTEAEFAEAREACAIATILVMQHGEPELYLQGLQGKTKAYDEKTGMPKPAKEVYRLYKDRKLALPSLTVEQMITIMETEQREEGMPESFVGLHPEFVSRYQGELEKLANVRLEDALTSMYRPEDAALIGEIFVRADLLDMNYPYQARIARSLLSIHDRPLVPRGDWDIAAFINLMQHGPGNDDVPESNPFINILKQYRSFIRRGGWEVLHADPFPETSLSRIPIVHEMYGEIAIRSALELQRSIAHAMTENYATSFDEAYEQRIREQAEHVVDRSERSGRITGAVAETLRIFAQRATNESLAGYVTRMAKRLTSARDRVEGNLVAKTFEQRLHELFQEHRKVVTILEEDLNRDIYPLQTTLFEMLTEKLIAEVARQYRIDSVTIEQYRQQMHKREVPSHIFFKKRYDTLSQEPRGWTNEDAIF